MDVRKVFAIVEVDADTAFEKIDDGPVPFLEQEFGWLEQSGISLKSCFIADEDEEDKWQAYLNYVAEWVFYSQGGECEGSSPVSYEKWCKSQYPAKPQ